MRSFALGGFRVPVSGLLQELGSPLRAHGNSSACENFARNSPENCSSLEKKKLLFKPEHCRRKYS
jgi:hypothetical protein